MAEIFTENTIGKSSCLGNTPRFIQIEYMVFKETMILLSLQPRLPGPLEEKDTLVAAGDEDSGT